MSWLPYILVFLATALVDLLWTLYIQASVKGSHLATLYNTALFLLGSVVFLSFTENHWLLLPGCLGAALGTELGLLASKPDRPQSL